MKKTDNLLGDLEKDICGDWGDIQNSFKEKEQKKEREKEKEKEFDNPQRLNLPNFQEFYELLFKLFIDGNGDNRRNLYDLHVMFRDVFFNHENDSNRNPMPKAFNEMWRIFCSPREYDCATGVKCNDCHSRWDIMYKVDQRRMTVDLYEEYNSDSIKIFTTRITCPTCSRPLLNITQGHLVGIFKHIHVDEKEEYREEKNNYMGEEYGIKREFGNYL